MIFNIEGLLLNVLFIFFFLLVIPSLIEKSPRNFSEKQKSIFTFILATLAVVFCMVFPFQIDEEVYLDFRGIPIILMALYGRIKTSLYIVAVIVVFRFFEDGLGIGLYVSVIVSVVMFGIFVAAILVFQATKTLRRKLYFGSFYTLMTSLTVFIVFSLLGVTLTVQFIVIYFLLHLFCVLVSIYFYETILESVVLSNTIRKAEKMEVVSQLAASISHEVRNPLTTIKGFLQLLAETDIPIEKRKYFIKIALEEVNRANEIISEYLTFAKPSLEKSEKLDIKIEVNHTINVISSLANFNCVEINTDIGNDQILGDSQLLQQCLINITKNCIEAMPNGGKLCIKSEECNDGIILKISDNGKGMTKEQLSRLGEPYYTTKGREGTGLGMMVVIRIIEMLKGSLHVTSKIDEGTTFKIVFPVVRTKSLK